jgi:hypothetical protein
MPKPVTTGSPRITLMRRTVTRSTLTIITVTLQRSTQSITVDVNRPGREFSILGPNRFAASGGELPEAAPLRDRFRAPSDPGELRIRDQVRLSPAALALD